MNEKRFAGEEPESTYSAARLKIEQLRGVIDGTDAAVELLKTDAEKLETFIEELINFVEIANKLGVTDIAKENKDLAMAYIDTLVQIRRYTAKLTTMKTQLETAIGRLETADESLTALAARTDKNLPPN